MTESVAQPTLDALPTAVRSRVVALVADVLPAVPDLPAPVRRVAEFAPARRPRAGAAAISAALEDDAFRERVATQVSARAGEDLQDPVEAAARAWLLRPEGWAEALADILRRAGEAREGTAADAEVARWRERAEQADQRARELRAEHRAQLEEQKSEISTLRRKLGAARASEREAREAGERAASELEETRSDVEARLAAQDKELRRLRAQVSQLEAELAAGRRSSRAEKDEATIRARLLLDTVLAAVSGLQRELALPPVTGSPGDRIERELTEAGTPKPAALMGGSSPALLEQYLSLPRARLIVDGYNVSKTAWPSSPLEAQRIRLVNGLAPLVARTGAETTVVFDAAESTSRPVVPAPRGVKVVFSPVGVIADDVIRDLAAVEPEGRVVVVVTDDQEVLRDVQRSGARTLGAETLIALLRTS